MYLNRSLINTGVIDRSPTPSLKPYTLSLVLSEPKTPLQVGGIKL